MDKNIETIEKLSDAGNKGGKSHFFIHEALDQHLNQPSDLIEGFDLLDPENFT